MVFRSLAAVLLGLSTIGLVTGVSFAEAPGTARDLAFEKLRSELRSGPELVGGSADTARWGEVRAAAVADTARPDPVAKRLQGVFDLVAPETALPALARLPVPRPNLRYDEEPLAYAAQPARTGASSRTRGLTVIEELVEVHAEANDVPPALAQALVQVESSHNPKATGRNGEIGLLQIKPKTARAMGYKGSAEGLYDPETNLAWGMKYLGKAHDLSGGDVCGTLLRYNAGLDAKRKSAASDKFCRKVKKVMAKRA